MQGIIFFTFIIIDLCARTMSACYNLCQSDHRLNVVISLTLDREIRPSNPDRPGFLKSQQEHQHTPKPLSFCCGQHTKFLRKENKTLHL